jgi:integrase/recombinase XerD
MGNHELLGPWIRRFLLEHIVGERNLSPNTQHSYRDTLTMLLPLVASRAKKPLDRLLVIDISADSVRAFLAHLEEKRNASVSTRRPAPAASSYTRLGPLYRGT